MLATPAAARREIDAVAAAGTSAAKVNDGHKLQTSLLKRELHTSPGGAEDAQVTAETKLTWIGIANMLAFAQQDPQDGGCAS